MKLSLSRLTGAVLLGAVLAECGSPGQGGRLTSPNAESPTAARAAATAPEPARPGALPGDTLTGEEVARRAAAVYDRARRALIRVQREDGNARGGEAGVIVTAEGHVLYRATPPGEKLTFRLFDGRRVTGTKLGWSWEWGIGLLKLEGSGPWPHVPLADSAGVQAGQCVLTLAHADSPDIVPRPLLGVDAVTRSARGRWFMTSDAVTVNWRNAPAVFDLDGNLVGVGWVRWVGSGTAYTDAKRVRSLWDDLVAGKNLDRVRLQPRPFRGPLPQALDPRAAEEKSRAATIRIRRRPGDRGFSGVLVTADGFVATCAHHFAMPGTAVTVCLPDGRDAAGLVVGINPVCDVGLVRITGPGPWPHVEMGDSTGMRPGDACLFIGYGPAKPLDRQPRVRKTSVARPSGGHWKYYLESDPATPFVGGDSGGGLFDAGGRLVAINTGIGGEVRDGVKRPHHHPRVELFRMHWDELNAALDQANGSPPGAAGAELRRAADRARFSVVEVLDGEKPVALGTVVGRGNKVLTQASALPRAPACRLPDGRVRPASLVKTSREHNLAVLRIEATDLRGADWSGAEDLPVGTPVAVVAPGAPPSAGWVSHPALAIPAERGELWVNVRDGARGLEVAEVLKVVGPSPFREGDVLVSVGGHPTPDRKAYRKLWQTDRAALTAGDSVRVVVTRDDKELELHPVLGPPGYPRPEGQSPRCSGFDRVYSVAVEQKSPLCGGPVIDREGRVVGVAIAWRARGWLLVMPAATAKTVSAD